jgi:hypothetical protein
MSKKTDDMLDVFWDFVLFNKPPLFMKDGKNIIWLIVIVLCLCIVYMIWRSFSK